MENNRPEVAIGHIVMHVSDAVKSAEFYSKLGLRIVVKEPGVSLVELLGGTHILLTDDETGWKYLPASRIGAKLPDRKEDWKEDFELMIAGKSRHDLEAYRERLINKGLVPGRIDDASYGHHVFQIDDPDENRITVYSSHAVGPV